MRAMILAAGRGERLRPLTDAVPKPLIDVGGKPLILHHIERLRRAGITELVINVSWLGDRIEAALGDGRRLGVRIRYSREPCAPLETAGGIRQALPLLGRAPFLVVSADVFTDFDPATLAATEADALAHLVLVDNPPHHAGGDFALADGRVLARGARRLTYSGIGRFRAELFAGLAPGVRALRPVLEASIAAGRVTGEHHTGTWVDVGTPERLQLLNRVLADGAPR